MTVTQNDNGRQVLRDGVGAILARLDAMQEQLDRVEAALAAKTTPTKGKSKHDEAYQQTLAFMKENPIRLTALIIASNTDLDNATVGNRLRTLIDEGLVESAKEDGKQATFKITAKAAGF